MRGQPQRVVGCGQKEQRRGVGRHGWLAGPIVLQVNGGDEIGARIRIVSEPDGGGDGAPGRETHDADAIGVNTKLLGMASKNGIKDATHFILSAAIMRTEGRLAI